MITDLSEIGRQCSSSLEFKRVVAATWSLFEKKMVNTVTVGKRRKQRRFEEQLVGLFIRIVYRCLVRGNFTIDSYHIRKLLTKRFKCKDVGSMLKSCQSILILFDNKIIILKQCLLKSSGQSTKHLLQFLVKEHLEVLQKKPYLCGHNHKWSYISEEAVSKLLLLLWSSFE